MRPARLYEHVKSRSVLYLDLGIGVAGSAAAAHQKHAPHNLQHNALSPVPPRLPTSASCSLRCAAMPMSALLFSCLNTKVAEPAGSCQWLGDAQAKKHPRARQRCDATSWHPTAAFLNSNGSNCSMACASCRKPFSRWRDMPPARSINV